MIVTVECAAVAREGLAELARPDAMRYPPRTPERRAGAALWAVLVTVADFDAQRQAYACQACGSVAEPARNVCVNADPMTRTRAREPMEHR